MQRQIHKHKYTNTNEQIQIHKYLTACSYPPPLQLSFLTRAVSCATGGSTWSSKIQDSKSLLTASLEGQQSKLHLEFINFLREVPHLQNE